MAKPDLVVFALAALAVVATTVGALKSNDWTDERTYRFEAALAPVPGQEPQAAGSAPARFEVPAPDNATALTATIDVAFTGQALQGGTAVVRVGGTAPDGTPLPTVTRAFAVDQGATSASLSIPYNATWSEVPGSVRDTQRPDGQAWAQPLVVLVTVERPSDAPVANYAFTTSLAGTFATYASA